MTEVPLAVDSLSQVGKRYGLRRIIPVSDPPSAPRQRPKKEWISEGEFGIRLRPAGPISELLPGATHTFGTCYIRLDRHGNVYRGCNTPLTPAQVHALGLPVRKPSLSPIAKALLPPVGVRTRAMRAAEYFATYGYSGDSINGRWKKYV
jgi:hypothetical protein